MKKEVKNDGVLAGKVAVITGASRGIGDAIARRFAMEGAKVVVSARTINDGEHYLPGTVNETVDAIRSAGGQAVGVKADLAIAGDRANLIREAESAFGSVDILVNNAAITYFIPVSEFPEKRFRLMMDVQVWAPFELAQLVLPGMRSAALAGYLIFLPMRRFILIKKRVATAVAYMGCVRLPWKDLPQGWPKRFIPMAWG